MVFMRNFVASIRAPDRSINQVLWKSCHVKHRFSLFLSSPYLHPAPHGLLIYPGSTTQEQVIFIFQAIRTSDTYRISRSEVNAQPTCPSTQQKHKDVFPVNGNTYIRNSLQLCEPQGLHFFNLSLITHLAWKSATMSLLSEILDEPSSLM